MEAIAFRKIPKNTFIFPKIIHSFLSKTILCLFQQIQSKELTKNFGKNKQFDTRRFGVLIRVGNHPQNCSFLGNCHFLSNHIYQHFQISHANMVARRKQALHK